MKTSALFPSLQKGFLIISYYLPSFTINYQLSFFQFHFYPMFRLFTLHSSENTWNKIIVMMVLNKSE